MTHRTGLRPWYNKKRFMIPGVILTLIILFNLGDYRSDKRTTEENNSTSGKITKSIDEKAPRSTDSKRTSKKRNLSSVGVDSAFAQTVKEYDRPQIKYYLQDTILNLAINTDLPPSIIVGISVGRSFWKKGNAAEYSIEYFSSFGTVGEWEVVKEISIKDTKWRSDLDDQLKSLSRAGISTSVERVSDSIRISVVIPHTNKPYPKFNETGRSEQKVYAPLRNSTEPIHEYEGAESLVVGRSYTIARTTPLMPELNPADPILESVGKLDLPTQSIIRIKSVKKKAQGFWYQVTAYDKTGMLIGTGWVNSVALIGQEIRCESDTKIDKMAAIGLKSELKGFIKSLDGDNINFDDFTDRTAFVVFIGLYKACGQIVARGKQSPDDSIKILTATLEQKVIGSQKKNFPKARLAFQKFLRNELWISDIDVSISGKGNTTLNFVGAIYAANKNIEESEKAIQEMVTQLRFKQTTYRWHKSADEYQYYTIDSENDDFVKD